MLENIFHINSWRAVMKNFMDQILVVAFLCVLLITSFTSQAISKVDPDLESKFETAKMNLVIGDTTIAQKQFIELEEIVKPVKDKSDEMKSFYSDIMYNLGLTYEQKYYDEKSVASLDAASTADLMIADEYFDKSDPHILEQVASMKGGSGTMLGAPPTRAIGGILGKIIKGKVKDWLKSNQNCSCSFTNVELNLAGKTFVALTEKTDIPKLKNTTTRDQKISEIFTRIEKYIAKLSATDTLKQLFSSKIQPHCKL